MKKFVKFAAAGVALLCGFAADVARAEESVGVELVTNGSFEDVQFAIPDGL